jgi:hypothetical protein
LRAATLQGGRSKRDRTPNSQTLLQPKALTIAVTVKAGE